MPYRQDTASLGGGVYNEGPLTVTHSTVRDNTAGGGGGFCSVRGGPLTVTHSTVSGNTARNGGGLSKAYGPLTLTSSIVASNAGGGDCDDYRESVTSRGYNLDSDTSCRLTAATDRPGVDPLLGPLQDNGGLTLTHALLPGSPAIDAIPFGTNGCGTTHIADQRGQARPQPAGGPVTSGPMKSRSTGNR